MKKIVFKKNLKKKKNKAKKNLIEKKIFFYGLLPCKIKSINIYNNKYMFNNNF